MLQLGHRVRQRPAVLQAVEHEVVRFMTLVHQVKRGESGRKRIGHLVREICRKDGHLAW